MIGGSYLLRPIASIVSIDGLRVRVRHVEALDATPIIDVKPVLGGTAER